MVTGWQVTTTRLTVRQVLRGACPPEFLVKGRHRPQHPDPTVEDRFWIEWLANQQSEVAVFLGLLRRRLKDATNAWDPEEEVEYRNLRRELAPAIRDRVIEQNSWRELIQVAFDLAEEQFPLVYREDAYDYFRPELHGIENVPSGRVLIVPNHSGQLPFDGVVISVACLLHAKPPRLCRRFEGSSGASAPIAGAHQSELELGAASAGDSGMRRPQGRCR